MAPVVSAMAAMIKIALARWGLCLSPLVARSGRCAEPLDICLNRPGQFHLVKIIDSDESRADNFTIIELQRRQRV